MADLENIKAALIAAHEAKDVKQATRLADLYRATAAQNQKTTVARPAPNSFVDAARSIPGGLAKGVTGLLGLVGDLGNPSQSETIEGVGGELKTVDKGANRLGFPTSSQLDKIVTAPTGGYYEPKTRLGKYTETAASFAPAALTGGGGAIARAARVLVPAIASEGAGQATEGTVVEPYARLAAALAGGLGVGRAQRAITASKVKIPTNEELKTASTKSYKEADDAGVVVSGKSFKKSVSEIEKTLDKAAFDSGMHPLVNNALNRLKTFKGDPSLSRLDILRQVINNAAASLNKNERRIALIMRNDFDDFVKNLSPADVKIGDAQKGVAALESARGNWSKVAKDDIVTRAIEKAKNRGETVSGSGLENAIRIEFRKIAQKDEIMRRFSKEEQDAIRNVSNGDFTANTLRRIGSFAPTGMKGMIASGMGTSVGATIGSYIAGPVGGLVGGPLVGTAIAGTGTIAKKLAEQMAKSRAQNAGEVMRGRPAPPAQQSFAKNPALLAALLSQQNSGEQ